MTTAKLIWATPDADKHIGYCARVSNPNNQDNPNVAGLLSYCAKNAHWSVFEMASVCIEVSTTRDIARQILRHRSFSFQEFSQRYADATQLGEFAIRECRMQDHKNRQNSLATDDFDLTVWWAAAQARMVGEAEYLYSEALKRGIAKEQARALLPEGLTPSKLYVNGTIRSWITFLQARLDVATQKEHRLVAQDVLAVLRDVAPVTVGAFFGENK
jgi:thymidylate synthase, flavin-dependent